ncbi:cytochrome c biogenesis protein CcdA [uncultured Candidatus Pelagibacter sp.]|mgnify:FL=1|jgi:cytochrome c-type biogenesis protein|uniref:cytochrome c biogenesis CcdA family protein n=1 Tax=uncultured Candidatus Pelagibacter sp. TaxID=372654 RepID=UPI00230C7ECF|nr:cytochrome c biogenesis protein CcdA [uncultured Candidatus Pelagibacter sp.]MDA7587759.1 cytochrome c biogenesis protein CcdA [Candidatus Pelagibacter sp.]MDC0897768.1 cytochrome c biogenesis protein CcdA [Candidatus Pelagibacter sp.]MDC1077466.1 cytochrome c biogenesis protein CcdA [Candidatus Pelagibacter sp.]
MIELLIAFGAGLISFLSPCVLPLIPGYVSFISGQSLQEILKSKKIDILPLILFCFGFSTVFIILGASASFLGQTLLQNSETLRVIAGVVIIIFSLQLIGLINISYLNFEKRFEAKKSKNILFPYLIGLAFGFGWTPCIGPILGSILALASIEETLSKAIILLTFYSIGLAIPFVLSGYLIQRFLVFSKNFKKNINLISKIGGIILLITGILILTNQLQTIGFYIIKVFPFMQNFG